ncbi:MAG: protease complex subunit PrcB family protein [Flavobacteriaceae bacterium]|nr:protease complex subunit PrcB family protein [Flavobacteriaceae bacterium]
MHLVKFNILCGLFILLACGTVQQKPEAFSNTDSCEVLISDEFGNTPEGKVTIARNSEIARQELSRINMTRKPGYELPEIDYRQSALVFVFLEEKPSGGYEIEFMGCAWNQQKLIVQLKTIKPEAGAMVTTAITAPFVVLKVPAAESINIDWQ